MTDTLTLEVTDTPPAGRAFRRAPVVLLVLGATLPAFGVWNPWNLVAVDVALRHPWVGVMAVLVALIWLWMRHAPRSWVGALGVGLLGLAIVVWMLIGGLIALLGRTATRPVEQVVAGPGNAVQAELRNVQTTDNWRISLYSDRGVWSRQQALHRVGYVACADSCFEPPLELEFTAADELSVVFDDQLVYRVRFDPHSLDVEHELCRVVERRTDSVLQYAVGCFDRPTGFWGWFSDA